LPKYEIYRDFGFLYIQGLVANAVLRYESSTTTAYISNLILPMRAEEYEKDELNSNIGGPWNFLIIFVFIPPVYWLIHNIVNEKEQKLRELMKMMGLTDFPYWLSWFCYYFVVILVLSGLITLLLIPIFTNSNKIFIFLYFFLYGLSLFSYSVFVSSFFSNGKVASIAGSLLIFVQGFLI